MNNKRELTALGKKFENFEMQSPMASFEAFEQKELQRRRSAFWWELGLLVLLSLMTIALVAKLGNHSFFTQAETAKQTSQLESGSKLSELKVVDVQAENPKLNNTNSNKEELISNKPAIEESAEDLSLASNAGESGSSDKPNSSFSSSAEPIDIPELDDNIRISLKDDVGLLNYLGLRYKLLNEAVFSKAKRPVTGLPTHKKGKLELWASFGSSFSTVSIGEVDTNYIHRDFREIYQEGRKVGLSPYVNVGMEYAISQNLNLNLGIGFSQQKVNGSYSFELWEIPVYDLDGTIGGYFVDSSQGSTQFETSSNFNYLELPVRINYQFALRTWDAQLGLGLNSAYLLSVKGNTIDPYMLFETRAEDIAQYKRFKSELNLRFAAYRSLYGNVSAGFEFQLNQGLTGRYKSDFLQGNSHNLRLGLVLKYSIPTQR